MRVAAFVPFSMLDDDLALKSYLESIVTDLKHEDPASIPERWRLENVTSRVVQEPSALSDPMTMVTVEADVVPVLLRWVGEVLPCEF